MKIRKQFHNLKLGAKRVFVGLMVLSLICTVSGIGTIYSYATEPIPENLELNSNPEPEDLGEPSTLPEGNPEAVNPEGGNPEGGSIEGGSSEGGTPAPESTPAPEGESSSTGNPEGAADPGVANPGATDPAAGNQGNTGEQIPASNPENGNTEGGNQEGTIPANPEQSTPASGENNTSGTGSEGGQTNTTTCQEHQFTFSHDENTHTGVCDVCGYTVTENHQITESRTDDGKIRKACPVCGYEVIVDDDGTGNVHEHEYVYVDNGDGTHTGVCSLCSESDPRREITEAHVMGEWASDGHGNHTRTCALCDYTETEECVYDEQTGLCKVCGFNQNALTLRSSLSLRGTLQSSNALRTLSATPAINHNPNKTYDQEVIEEMYTITSTDDVTYDGTAKSFCSSYGTGTTVINIVELDSSNTPTGKIRKYEKSGDLQISYINSSGTGAASVTNAGDYTTKFSLTVLYTAPDSTTAESQTLTFTDSTVHKILTKPLSDSDITINQGNVEDYSTYISTSEFGHYYTVSFNGTNIPITYSISPAVDGAPASNVDYVVTMSPSSSGNFSGSVSRTVSVPRIQLLYDGFEEIASAYYNQVAITCSGYVISDAVSGTYSDTYTLTQSGDKTLYVKKDLSGGSYGPAIKVNTGTITISNEAPNFGLSFDDCFNTAPSPKGTLSGTDYRIPCSGAQQDLFSSLGTVKDLVNTSTPTGYIITAVDKTGVENKVATNAGKYTVTLSIKLTANYGGASFTNTLHKEYSFVLYKLNLSNATVNVKSDYRTADGKIDYSKVSGSDYKSAIEVTADGVTLASDKYNVEVTGMPEIPMASNTEAYNVTISPNGDVYEGTKTENGLVKVPVVGLSYEGYGQGALPHTLQDYYIKELTITPSDTTYQIGTDGNSFSSNTKITESCEGKVFTVYLKNASTGKIFKEPTGLLEIRNPLILFDDNATKQSDYANQVKISTSGEHFIIKKYTIDGVDGEVSPDSTSFIYNDKNHTKITLYLCDNGSPSPPAQSAIAPKYANADYIIVTITDLVIVNDSDISTYGILFNQKAYKPYFNETVHISTNNNLYDISKPGQAAWNDIYTVDEEGVQSITVDFRLKSTSAISSNVRIKSFTIDKTAPTGSIEVAGQGKESGTTKKFTSFTSDSSVAFGVTSQPKITITSEDGLSGVAKVQYVVTDKFYSSSSALLKDHPVDSYNWQDYSSDTTIQFSQAAHNYLYVAITDNAGNVTYLSTGDVMYDNYGPKGRIVVGDYTSSTFQSTDSVAVSASSAPTVNIVDDPSEFTVTSIEFFVSDKFYKDVLSVKNAVAAGTETWRNKTQFTPTIFEGKKNYVYAVLRSTSGFEMYLSTGAIIYDTVAPTITANNVTKSSDNKYVLDVSSYDALSGVDKMKAIYSYENPGSTATPTKDEITKNGVDLTVTDSGDGTFKGTYSVDSFDPARNYIFYVVSIDKAGNISDVSQSKVSSGVVSTTGSIIVDDYVSTTFQTQDSMIKYSQSVTRATITATNDKVGIDRSEYYVSDTFYPSPDEVESAISEKKASWSKYSEAYRPTTVAGKKNYIYARIVDKNGNYLYLSTGSIAYDTAVPKVTSGTATLTDSPGKYTVAVGGTDDLSGIDVFKFLYFDKSTAKNLPDKDAVAKTGITVTSAVTSTGSYSGTLEITDLDAKKNYLFFFVAVDKAGNISDVFSYELKSSVNSSTGKISVDDYSSDIFRVSDDTALYVKDAKKATITATNNAVGIDKIEFFVSDTYYGGPDSLLAAMKEKNSAWVTYSSNNQPQTVKDKKNYIYAKITDKNGASIYLSTSSITYDTVAPTLSAHTVAISENGKEFKVGVGGKDTLSGITRFQMIVKEKTSDKMTAPSQQDIYDNGATIEVSKDENGNAIGVATLAQLDVSKAYIFYFIAIDRAGNISTVESEETKASAASGSGASGSGSSSGSGSKSSLTPAPSGIAGSGSASSSGSGSSSGRGSGTKQSTQGTKQTSALGSKDRVISRSPFIKDATGNTKIGETATGGWNKISTEVKTADKGAVVEVEMSGTSSIPKELLESMSGKDVVVKLNMADNVQWEIKGDKVSTESLSEKNMGVKLGSRNIPDRVLAEVTGSYPHVEFSMLSTESFGFDAAIIVPVGKSSAGMNATLYKYNAAKKELMAVGTAVIDAHGNVKFDVDEAADYSIVVTPDKLLTSVDASASGGLLTNDLMEETSDFHGSSTIRLTDIFGHGKTVGVWLIALAVISAGISAAILFAPSLQIKREDEFSKLLK